MINVLSTAVSALRAFGTKLQGTASNIANINTENYKPVDVSMQETKTGGVRANVSRSEEAYKVNPSKEIVDTIVTEHAFKANIETIKAEEETLESIINIKA